MALAKKKIVRQFSLVETPAPVAPGVAAQLGVAALQMFFLTLTLLAGLDKYFFEFANWTLYVSPVIPQFLGISSLVFLQGVGALEICLAIFLVFRPAPAADFLGAWLLGAVLNLVFQGEYFDLAVVMVGLAAGAFAFARLARERSGRDF